MGVAWELLHELVRIDSSDPGAYEDEIERRIKGIVEQAVSVLPVDLAQHVAIEELEVLPGRRNLMVTVQGTDDEPHLVYICHMDTVTLGDGWSSDIDPLGALERDGGAMPSSATQGLPYAIHRAAERGQDAQARPQKADGVRAPRSECDGPLALDMEPTVLGLLDGIAAGIDPDTLALALHEAVAQAAADAARLVSLRTGIRTVALSGGVFMNRLLLTRTAALLESAGMRVLIPTTVPVNDGCIAYGQAAVARAHLARR